MHTLDSTITGSFTSSFASSAGAETDTEGALLGAPYTFWNIESYDSNYCYTGLGGCFLGWTGALGWEGYSWGCFVCGCLGACFWLVCLGCFWGCLVCVLPFFLLPVGTLSFAGFKMGICSTTIGSARVGDFFVIF